MIKCKADGCPIDGSNSCCFECNEREVCADRCDDVPAMCKFAETVQTTDLNLFQSKAMMVMQKIADLDRQKKILDEQDKVVRKELQEAMDKYGIKKFENDILKVTYVEPTVRTTIDAKKLKEELPAVAEKYTKRSMVKGSVRIEVK